MATREFASMPEKAERRDLASWWKNFKKGAHKKEDERGEHGGYVPHSQLTHQIPEGDAQGIFGVPLATSVRYANVAISLNDTNGQSYIYGYVPIVVAKCGVFLKEKATDVEGIFRLSGSEKRIKELRNTFNSPDRYGKGLDWSGYTVHDAANILRRYFNQLPEPIIPLEFYDRFRDPLRDHQSQAVGPMDGQTPSVGDFNHPDTIKTYQQIITQLPPLNRQLLLYILDLLAVFASKSDLNKMTTPNLAAIFQPGILSHPAHDMSPPEYRLSQDVLIFLIENQDHFLIGMQGTAADERTVQEVESGPPTPQHRSSTPRHSKSTVVRSGSNSSRYSGVRRSVSASSRRSRNSAAAAAPSPVGSDFHTPLANPPPSAIVHRSNTLPPTRSPNLTPGRFGREKDSSPQATEAIKENVEVKNVDPPKAQAKLHSQPIMQEIMTPTDDNMPEHLPDAAAVQETLSPAQSQAQPTQPKNLNREAPGHLDLPSNTLQVPNSTDQTTPTGTSKIVATLFGAKSPPAEGIRRPNKLQKKRAGGSANPSAHSSTHSLNDPSDNDPSQKSIQNSLASTTPLLTPRKENIQGAMWQDDGGALKTPPPIGGNYPNMSPAASYASQSDVEGTDPDHFNLQGDENASDSGRRRNWFSRERKAEVSHQTPLGSNGLAQASRSSVLSGGEGGGRKSVSVDRSGYDMTSDSEKKEKNPISWFKGKVRDFQDKLDDRDRDRKEKRMASPTRVPGERSPSNALTDPQNIDSVAAGSLSPSRKVSTEQQLMPPPPIRTSISSRDSGRGQSMDLPRPQASFAGPGGIQRQSQDIPRSNLPLQTSAQPQLVQQHAAQPPIQQPPLQHTPAQPQEASIAPLEVINDKP